MKITRDNYESFFIDHIDGNLSNEREEELRSFLAANPDLSAELDDVKATMSTDLDPPALEYHFQNKDSLKKNNLPISDQELLRLLISELEQTNSDAEKKLLDELSNNFPFVAKTRVFFALTKLTAPAIPFEKKYSISFPNDLDLVNDEFLIIAAIQGDLHGEDLIQFERKLNSDSHFERQYQIFKTLILTPGFESFTLKNKIKIPAFVDTNDLTNLLIAKVEGDLSLLENNKLSAALALNASLQNELDLFYKTKLRPSSLIYANKSALKKRDALVVPFRSSILKFTAIAASLVLIVLIVQRNASHPAQLASSEEYHNQISLKINEGQNDIAHITENSTDAVKTNNAPMSPFTKNTNEDAIAYDTGQDDTLNSRPSSIEYLNSKTSVAFALSHQPDMASEMPEMRLILDNTYEVAQASHNNESITLLAYLGKIATEKIESTNAFAYAEKQVEKIANKTKDEIKVETTSKEQSEELLIKLGRFEYRSTSSEKKRTGKTAVNRVSEFIQKLNK